MSTAALTPGAIALLLAVAAVLGACWAARLHEWLRPSGRHRRPVDPYPDVTADGLDPTPAPHHDGGHR